MADNKHLHPFVFLALFLIHPVLLLFWPEIKNMIRTCFCHQKAQPLTKETHGETED